MVNDHFALFPGTLVYLDSFSGLIPAQVVAYEDDSHVEVRVTAQRPGFRKGETLTRQRVGWQVIHRDAVVTRRGIKRILSLPHVAYPGTVEEEKESGMVTLLRSMGIASLETGDLHSAACLFRLAGWYEAGTIS